ncbi:cytochrome P450 [Micromonospora aurantiaca]|uniref:cytochrome P450 n=1 Tax=Micromonospora aurantiaca (nom. illeg.) TaxID=47850 RepID=UPI00345553AF
MTTSSPPGIAADFLATVTGAAYADDPYPFLRRLRDEAPAVRTNAGIWLVSRYDDVRAGLRDPRLSCDLGRLTAYDEYFRTRGIDARFPLPLNALDAPDHPRIRSAMSHEFVPQAVDAMRPAIDAAVAEVVGALPDRGEIDLVADVAYPVPIAVIGRLFGLPWADWPLLERWSRAFGAASDPDALLSDAQRDAAAEATREAGDYFGRLLTRRRREPTGDLMSRWLAAQRAERTMTLAELLVNGVFLLIVGHHNTVSLIGNGMLALLRHPEQLDRLRAGPALMTGAVDELLRYDSPVQTATRVTTGEHRVGDVTIPAGQPVMLLVGSANRDERAFPDPDRLDVDRPGANRNLGFGRGAHACVGGYLARLETAATLTALLRARPGLALAGAPRRAVPSFSLRALTALPLRVDRAPHSSR